MRMLEMRAELQMILPDADIFGTSGTCLGGSDITCCGFCGAWGAVLAVSRIPDEGKADAWVTGYAQ